MLTPPLAAGALRGNGPPIDVQSSAETIAEGTQTQAETPPTQTMAAVDNGEPPLTQRTAAVDSEERPPTQRTAAVVSGEPPPTAVDSGEVPPTQQSRRRSIPDCPDSEAEAEEAKAAAAAAVRTQVAAIDRSWSTWTQVAAAIDDDLTYSGTPTAFNDAMEDQRRKHVKDMKTLMKQINELKKEREEKAASDADTLPGQPAPAVAEPPTEGDTIDSSSDDAPLQKVMMASQKDEADRLKKVEEQEKMELAKALDESKADALRKGIESPPHFCPAARAADWKEGQPRFKEKNICTPPRRRPASGVSSQAASAPHDRHDTFASIMAKQGADASSAGASQAAGGAACSAGASQAAGGTAGSGEKMELDIPKAATDELGWTRVEGEGGWRRGSTLGGRGRGGRRKWRTGGMGRREGPAAGGIRVQHAREDGFGLGHKV